MGLREGENGGVVKRHSRLSGRSCTRRAALWHIRSPARADAHRKATAMITTIKLTCFMARLSCRAALDLEGGNVSEINSERRFWRMYMSGKTHLS
jgi:hypothetical protein